MLIDLAPLVDEYQMDILGVLHIGAHEAEEYNLYQELGVPRTVWVEANPTLAKKLRDRFENDPTNTVIPKAVAGELRYVDLNIANNGQSSSLLPLGTHTRHHPEVEYVESRQMRAVPIDSLVKDYGVSGLNFWNLDIQGMEFDALRGAHLAINMADFIYTEVNREELYEGCGLIDDIDELLADKGFWRVETAWTPHEWGDALYIRETVLP